MNAVNLEANTLMIATGAPVQTAMNAYGLTVDERQHWQAERDYWRKSLRACLAEHYALEMHECQDDDRTVPGPGRVAQIQSASKCCPDIYFATGQRTVLEYLRELKDYGFDPMGFDRILEFGVGLGRLIRHFYPFAAQLYGCDVTSEAIDFTQRVLGRRVALTVNDERPPLPYPDGFFDFIYANSVFTHIQMAETVNWISELHRILRPGGVIIVTLFDANHYLRHLSQREFDEMSQGPGYLEWGTSAIAERYMYMTPRRCLELWGKHFTVLELRHHFRDQSHLILARN